MNSKYLKVRAITITAITIVVVGVPILIYTLMHAGSTVAAWYNDSWGYRTKLTIDNTKVGGANEVFDIGNETGDLSQYDSTITDGGNLSVTSAAALNGSNYGLSALINDNNILQTQKNLTKSTKIRYRFYVDPNSITMATNDHFTINSFDQGGGSYATIAHIQLRYFSGSYYFSFSGYNDASSGTYNEVAISDAPHYVEVYAIQAATSVSSDGSYEWWIDGVDQGTSSGIDNYNLMSDQNWRQYLEADGVMTGTRGTVYFDDFVANSDGSMIGPVLTDFPVYVDLSKLPLSFQQHVNQTDGRDIRVTKADGTTELPREVVSYTGTNDTGELYFKYSGTLSSSTNTSVYIYYGNPSATDYSASATYGKNNVWDSSYVLVQHLTETSGQHSDSTSNGSNSTTVTVDKEGTLAGAGPLYGSDHFNGTNNLVEIPDKASLDPTGDMTVEAWAKLDALPTTRSEEAYAVDKHGASNSNFVLRVSSSSNKPFMNWVNSSGTTYFSSYDTALTTGTWYHLVGVHDGSVLRFYFNGSATGTTTDSPTGTNYAGTSPLRFGTNSATGSTSRFPGYIDEVRISNSARSATWINTEYNNENSPSTFFTSQGGEETSTGPIAWWHFDEGYGSTAYDSTKNSHNLTLASTAWATSSASLSNRTRYLQFNGATSQASVADTTDLNFGTSSFSISGWFRHSGTITGTDTIIDKYSTAGWKVYMNSSGYICFDIDADSTFGGSNYDSACSTSLQGSFADSKWHVFEAVKSGTASITLYVDGNQVAQDSSIAATGTLTSTATLYIGVDTNTNWWDGWLDEIIIYPYARTSGQVLGDTEGLHTETLVGASTVDPLTHGLVGYWKMDENTGTSTTDSSGNGNNSTTWTGATWAAGKFGSATSYNGSDQVVRFAESSSTDLGATTDSYTVSAWIKFTSCANVCDIFDKMSNSSAAHPFHLYIDSTNKPYFSFRDSAGNLSTAFQNSALTAGTWYHLTAVRDKLNNKLYLYVNGSLTLSSQTATDTTTTSATNNDDISIGNGGGSYTNNDFNGAIDDVRLYNRALTPAEVRQLYNWAPGPVGWWKMDENAGTSINDSSGNGNNSTTWTGATWTSGKFGSGTAYNGSNQVVRIAESTTTDLGATTDSYTVGAWFKTSTDFSASAAIIEKATGGTFPFVLYINSSEKACFAVRDGATGPSICYAATTVNDGRWHYITGVRNVFTDTAYLYLDGVMVNSTTDTTTTTAVNNDDISIGNGSGSYTGEDFTGSIDDARIYNYARTPGQIVEDMNAGHPAPGSPVGSALGHWKFDEGADNTCSGGVNDVCNSGSQGTNIDGAQSNMAAPGTSSSGRTNAGKFGKALNFDSSDDVINLGSNAAIDDLPATGMTISAWIYPTSAGENSLGFIMTKSSTNGGTAGSPTPTNGWFLRMNSTTSLMFAVDGSTDLIRTTNTSLVTQNAWNHIVVSWDGVITTAASVHIYINGIEASYATITNGASRVSDASSTLYIGNDTTGARTFAGTIDDVYLYNFGLTIDQIKVLYNQGGAAVMSAVSTDSSLNASFASQREYCPPGNTEGNCGGSNDPSPVGYWKLDENTGSTAIDSSGNGFNATWAGTGSSHWVPGKVGSAGHFNGTDDWAYINDISSKLNLVSTTPPSFTEEAWFYIGTSPNDAEGISLVCQWSGCSGSDIPGNNFRARLAYATSISRIIFQLVDGSTYVSALTTTNLNTWVHAAAVYDASTHRIYLYINGVLQESAISASTDLTDSTMRVAIGNAQNFFKGSLDDVRVYAYVRTPAQIAWDYNQGKPYGWWKMDETSWTVDCSTSTVKDSSGNGHDGKSCPSSTGPAGGAAGKYNNAGSFDGSNDYVDLGDLGITAATNSVSYTMWINTPETSGFGTFFADTNAAFTDSSLALTGTTGNVIQAYIWDGSNQIIGARSISANVWHNIALVIDRTAGTRTLYIDGVVSASDAHISPGGSYTRYQIGKPGVWNAYHGQIDDVRIYNYALSTQQLNTVMNQGSAVRFGP